jgi:hypothetical protein
MKIKRIYSPSSKTSYELEGRPTSSAGNAGELPVGGF